MAACRLTALSFVATIVSGGELNRCKNQIPVLYLWLYLLRKLLEKKIMKQSDMNAVYKQVQNLE